MPVSETRRPPAGGNPYIRDLLQTSVLAAAIGVTMGFVALGVRVAIAFVTGLFFRGEVTTEFTSPAVNGWGALVVLVPAVGGLLAYGIARFVSNETRVRGVAEVIDIIMRRRGAVSPRKVTGNAIATIVSVGSGGSAGREGAMVQLGAAAGLFASLLWGASIRHRKILIAAGGAGAVAGTFNTPIAGVIFAAEVVLLEWSTRSFIPLTISSAFSVTVSRYFLGDQPAFAIPTYELVSNAEIALYIALGIIAGLMAILTFRALDLGERVFALLPWPTWSKPAVGGLLVGAIGLFLPQVFGVGYEWVRLALAGEVVAWFLALILVAKLVAFSLTRGSGGASGAFSPSLFLGAMLGGVFGEIVHAVWPAWTATSGAYALVGMAAVYAAVTRASLTAVVMLYEMTHQFNIVIPVMIAVVIADGLSKAYAGTTLYAPRGGRARPLETDASVNILDLVSVGEIMTRQVETVHEDAPVRQIFEKRFRTGHQGYPVINGRHQLVGIITATDLREKVKDADLDRPIKNYMTADPVCVNPSTSSHEALTEMVRLDVGHLPVVAEDAPRRLVGFLTRQDLIGVERRVLEEERKGESVFEKVRESAPWRRRMGP